MLFTSLVAACASDDGDSTDSGSATAAPESVTSESSVPTDTDPPATDPPPTDPPPTSQPPATDAPAETEPPAATTAATDPPPEESDVSVILPDHPIYDTTVLLPDQQLLDGFAADYLAGLDGADPEMERFLFGTLPVQVFDQVFSGDVNGDAPELLWAMYLSGWFGGRWLRGEIAAAQPDAPLAGFSIPPDEAAFQDSMAKAQVALDARDGDDAAAVAYASESLVGFPGPEGAPEGGLADSFGYNVGYMLQILEAPPEGLITPEKYGVTCDGVLSCTYASPKLAVLEPLESVEDALSTDPAYAELAAIIGPIQDAAIPRGRSVWSSGLSVQGFPQDEYDQLLDVSSSFLETVQATALTMSEGSATSDAGSARTGALANATMTVWLDGYTAGLLNGEGDIELPTFES
jgi:hypothetical protein